MNIEHRMAQDVKDYVRRSELYEATETNTTRRIGLLPFTSSVPRAVKAGKQKRMKPRAAAYKLLGLDVSRLFPHETVR